MSLVFHDEVVEMPKAPSQERKALYFYVSPLKFVVMNLATFGTYHIFWFYKCWKYVADNLDEKVSPFGRSVFPPFFFISLFDRLFENRRRDMGVALLVGYLVVTAAHRLKDPYWLVSVFAFAFLLPLVFKVRDLNRLNRTLDEYRSGLTWKSALTVVAFGPVVTAVVASTLGVIPSADVIPGSALSEGDIAFLRRNSMLDRDEKVDMFYTGGLLSMEEQGVFFSTKRVAAYEYDEELDVLFKQSAYYESIADISTAHSEGALENMIITVMRDGEGSIILSIPNTSEGRDAFVERLRTRWLERRGKPTGDGNGLGADSDALR